MNRRVPTSLACIVVVMLLAARVGGTTPPAGGAATTPREDPAKAGALLDDAAWYVEVNEPANARQRILEALDAARANKEVRTRATELWAKASEEDARAEKAKTDEQNQKQAEDQKKTKENQLARLDEAERKAERGENDAAATTALEVLKETKDEEVTRKADALLKNNRPATPEVLRKNWDTIRSWVLSVMLVAFVLLALWLLLRFWRYFWAAWANYSWSKLVGPIFQKWVSWIDPLWVTTDKVQRERKELRRWVVGAFNDTTTLGVAEAVTTSLSRWKESSAPASAGLLKLGTMQLPSTPQIESPEVQVDLAPALEALPLTIGGINLGSAGKVIAPLRNWLGAKRLWIKGSASAVESTVVVRLTRRNANDTTDTVTATADKSKAAEAAESASFKMYYLIAKDSSVPDADGADKLRNGLKLLGQYVSGRDPKQLEAAYEAIREARGENPALYEAYLYEGVALDMMERHDEAVTRFEYLIEGDADREIKNKAKYNKAVSLFRKYEPEKLDEAIQLLDDLSKPERAAQPEGAAQPPTDAEINNALIGDPVKSLAYAAQANAVAHKPIFWRHYANVPKGADEATVKRLKTDARGIVGAWVQEVNNVTARLNTILGDAKTKVTPWDVNTRQQLKWAIQNATGNIHLNCASRFYIQPYVSEDEPGLREKALKKAYDAFQQCEMLLPPGVETLTNLATVLMELKRGEDSRGYSLRAVDLNPDYEYAYYRLAQAWEQDGRIDELVKVLRLFAKDKTPSIYGFQMLYGKHAVDLAKFPSASNGDNATHAATTQTATNTATGK